MNVYDFDGTIYDGDSTRDFVLYLLKHYKRVIVYIPPFLGSAIKYKIGLITKTKMKETLYQFLKSFKDGEIESIVKKFWDTHRQKLYAWYYKKRTDSDLIISASPRFILEPICRELNVNLICSEVNVKTGDYVGINCYGEEKVNRFLEIYKSGEINEFYSDSKSDAPLAKLAKSAYLVKRGCKIESWIL